MKKLICRLFGHDVRPSHAERSGADVTAKLDRVMLRGKCVRCAASASVRVPVEYVK